MAGTKRLLLIRRKDVRANLINESGFAKFVKSAPIPIRPAYGGWEDDHGLTHYGYLLEGLNLEDLEKLEEFNQANTGVTILMFDKVGPKKIEESLDELLLRTVSLVVNKLGADKLLTVATPSHQLKTS